MSWPKQLDLTLRHHTWMVSFSLPRDQSNLASTRACLSGLASGESFYAVTYCGSALLSNSAKSHVVESRLQVPTMGTFVLSVPLLCKLRCLLLAHKMVLIIYPGSGRQ